MEETERGEGGGILNTTGVKGSLVDFVAGNHYNRVMSALYLDAGDRKNEELGAAVVPMPRWCAGGRLTFLFL